MSINKLYWIAGNKLKLAIPLQIVTFTSEGKVREDYYPDENAKLFVDLKGNERYRYKPTVVDNVITITDEGQLPVGEYAVEIGVIEPNGTHRRSKWNGVLTIYDNNAPVLAKYDDFPDYAEGQIVEGNVFIQGERGEQGIQGMQGVGVPSGGTTGQVLKKKTNTDFDTEWEDESGGGTVASVNGKTGAVTLDASDVGALPSDTSIPSALSELSDDSTHRVVTDTEKTTWNNKSNFSGNYNDLTNKPTIPTVPTNVSTFTNDAGYLTQHQDISGKADKSTTLAGYGITDAKIEGGVITLGSSTITPLTSHQDISGKANSADLATVATSGSYNDLNNKPTIPDAQIQSDWNQTDNSKKDFIKNKPTIPTVPTNVSSFVNDAGYLTQHQSLSGYATEIWVGQQGFLTQHQDISGKADKVVVVDASTPPASLDPNKVYQFGTLTGTVTIPAFSSVSAGDTEAKIWCFTFDTSTTAPTITWPAGITSWNGGSAPTINASKSYEVSVMNGIGVIIEA